MLRIRMYSRFVKLVHTVVSLLDRKSNFTNFGKKMNNYSPQRRQVRKGDQEE